MPTITNLILNNIHSDRRMSVAVKKFGAQIASEFNSILDLQFQVKDVTVSKDVGVVDIEIIVGNDERDFMLVFYYFENRLMVYKAKGKDLLLSDGYWDEDGSAKHGMSLSPEEIAKELLTSFSAREIVYYMNNLEEVSKNERKDNLILRPTHSLSWERLEAC